MSNETSQISALQPTEPKKLSGLEDDHTTPSGDHASQQKQIAADSEQGEFSFEDAVRIPFTPPDIPKNPLQQFTKSVVSELGLAQGHAWAVVYFVISTLLSKNCLYTSGGRLKRLSLNFLLAGDDLNTRARELSMSLLEAFDVDVTTIPKRLQMEKELKYFSSRSTRALVATGDENIFERWEKTSAKEAVSLSQLFSAKLLNDYLREEIRASLLPPVAVPTLLACMLKEILGSPKFPNSVFREALVIPSFGCSTPKFVAESTYSALIEQFTKQIPGLPTEEEIQISLNAPAEKTLNTYLTELYNSPLPLSMEGSASHQRRAGAEQQTIAIAAVTAFLNSSSNKGEAFAGKITKPDMEYAIEVVKMAHFSWEGLNKVKEDTIRQTLAENVYYLTLSKYANQRDDIHKGVRVKFTQLTSIFCHHPDREGQFYSKELLTKILPELVASGKAKRLTGPDKDVWIFFENR